MKTAHCIGAGALSVLMLFVGTAGGASGPETLSAATYRRLQEAQARIDEGQPVQAIATLQQLEQEVGGQPYEYALVMQYLSHAQTLADDPAAALQTVSRALRRSDLPFELALDLRYYQAKLFLALERYGEGLASLDHWFAQTAEPGAEAHYYRGFARYQLGRYEPAQESLEQALALAEKPDRRWQDVLLAAYVQGGDRRNAARLLRSMISESPGELRLWKQLASLHVEAGNKQDALATLVLADRLHALQPGELDAIVGFYGSLGMPDKAARMLETWVQAGRLEDTPARQRHLADLWLLARERTRAQLALERVAGQTATGEVDQLLGKLYMEDGEWSKAAPALEKALAKGGLDGEAARTRVLLGVARLKAGETRQAVEAFTVAARDPATRATAEYWIGLATASAEAAGTTR